MFLELPLEIINLIYEFYFNQKQLCEYCQYTSKPFYITDHYFSIYYVNITPKTYVQNYLCNKCFNNNIIISNNKEKNYCNFIYEGELNN